MATDAALEVTGGRLVANIMYFARVLRASGMAIGPGKVLSAVQAVRVVGVTNREDFYWALHAVFVNRAQQREIFDQAFHVFWRNPRLLERMMSLVLPTFAAPRGPRDRELLRRVGEAMGSSRGSPSEPSPRDEEMEFDAALTWSADEVLRSKDFEQMTAEEIARAKSAVSTMRLPLMNVLTRRFRAHPRGERIDMRATLRAALRSGGGFMPLARRRRRTRHPPIVIICDISGSMSRYSRMVVVLIVMAVLMALSALGIEVGPLIAGAGVVGVAIGFGAQTLVKDIISGMFFLLDDAFRVGEYIISGSYKGTVESFSLRSVKLRHHRGYLYTVPFGELGAVQNMSRDWVIDKLLVSVTYDTDLDKTKRVIKDVSKQIMADPELAPNVIEPLKMQGVEQFGDFAIQIRLKMMTKPGEQFVIRRRAYAMIKKAFAANDIEFAFPTVTVAGGDASPAVAQQALELTKPQAAAE